MQSNKMIFALALLTFTFVFLTYAGYPATPADPDKSIMVFGAHADDVEQMAGGTLAKYIDMGYEGIYVVVTNNTAGCLLNRAPSYSIFTKSNSPQIYPADALETIQIRTEEARQAAAVFGATPVFLNFRETWIWQGRMKAYIGSAAFFQFEPPGRQIVSVATRTGNYPEDFDMVLNLFKKHRPEITIIHTLGGEKHDHGNSAYLVYLAFKKAMTLGIPVGKLWMKARGWLAEHHASGRGKTDVRIDVSEYLDIKYKALSKHVSQKGYDYKSTTQDNYEAFITVIDN